MNEDKTKSKKLMYKEYTKLMAKTKINDMEILDKLSEKYGKQTKLPQNIFSWLRSHPDYNCVERLKE